MRFEAMWWLKFRRWALKLPNAFIFPDVFFEGIEGLKVGRSVSFNRGCNISAAGGLTIGNHVSIGHSTSIVTSEHGFTDPSVPIQLQPVTHAPVTIASNVWIGARSIILAGVSLAEGTIVAAGSVVTKSVTDPNSTIAGVPARVIKRR